MFLTAAFRPDPLQRSPELTLTHRSCQGPLADGAADPPDLQTTKGKGEQTQLERSPVEVVHQGKSFERLLNALLRTPEGQ